MKLGRTEILLSSLLATWPCAQTRADVPGYTPLRLAEPVTDVSSCEVTPEDGAAMTGAVNLSLKIDERGRIGESSLPDGSPAWQRVLADCVLGKIRLSPEIRDFKPAAASATLRIAFEPVGEGESRLQRLTSLGPLLTPARHRASGSEMSRCIRSNLPAGGVDRVILTLTVAPDGSIRDVEVPAGADGWPARTAECLKRKVSLFPGSRNGVAVESQVRLPVMLYSDYKYPDLQAPEPPSDPDLIEAAYRACYPSDQLAMGSVHFTLDVNADGSVSNAKIVRSSGDPVLDEAASCILPRLKFKPMMRGKKPVKSSIAWELPVRPPR